MREPRLACMLLTGEAFVKQKGLDGRPARPT